MHQEVNDDYESFCKNKLFEGLGPDELKAIYDLTTPIVLEPGQILFNQWDEVSDLFFITHGTLEITKHDPEISRSHLIERVTQGNVIGELSFIDEKTYYGSVQAKTKTTLRRISFIQLEKQINQKPKYAHIHIQLAKNLGLRLRKSSDQALQHMKRGMHQNKIRVQMGNFLVFIMITLSAYNYSLEGLQYLIKISPNTSYVALPFTIILGVLIASLIIFSKISWKMFGVSLSHWKQAAVEGFLFSLPMMALCVLAKWLLIRFTGSYEGQPLFDPFAVILNPVEKTWLFWFGLNSIYWFIIVPIQELITRGLLQGMLEIFLSGKHKIALSIFLSNLIFSTGHLFFSFEVAIVTFFGGLYMGWIYSRTHNLISSIIAHALLGTWFLSIVGATVDIQK